jgi:hypothetical protein
MRIHDKIKSLLKKVVFLENQEIRPCIDYNYTSQILID